MPASTANWIDIAVFIGVMLAALPFKPWLALKHPPLQHPWCCAMLILPAVWWTQHMLPSGMVLQAGGACMLVLMFGWPLAMWSLLPVALLAQVLRMRGWPDIALLISQVVWLGALPGTLALLLGLAVRHWLPKLFFVYILGRAFAATALALSLTGLLALWAGHKPATLGTEEWLLAHWLMGWGEAISTGMLTAVFVAFRPEWLLTYSDRRYLPGAKGSA